MKRRLNYKYLAFQVGFAAGLGVLSVGCATGPRSSLNFEPLKQNEEAPAIPFEADNGPGDEFVVAGVRLKNTKFDLPIRINSAVERWVEYFTGKGRKHFELYLERAEVFVPYMVPILRENGMPEDLVYLSMIESGFNNHARSRAKAVGAWQFIAGTGKRYGLGVNWWVDERRDIRKSTLAAVEYLRALYSVYRSWELAAAAYNSGEAKIARAVQRYGVMDFWTLARHRFLRPETRNYVPKMFAAAIVAKNRTQFGFPPAGGKKPAADELIAPDGSVVKIEHQETIQESITDSQAQDRAKTEKATLAKAAPQAVPTPHMSRKGELGRDRVVEFEVQSPADLAKIADASGLTYTMVKSLNPELLRWCTPPGKSYRVKLPESAAERFLSTYNHPEFPREVKFRTHKVRPGETIKAVARRYGFRPDPILDLNGLSKGRETVRAGTELLLPIPSDRSRSYATLDLIDPPSGRRSRRRRRAVRHVMRLDLEGQGAPKKYSLF